MKYAIVANPAAGKLSIDEKSIILEMSANLLGDCKVYGLDTKSVEEFRKCADDVSKKADTLIVAGGDGTFLDIINSVSKDVTLAYIPLGSGNAIKYALKFPKSIHKITENIKKGSEKSLDLILCDNSQKTFFASVGIEGHIIKEREKNREKGLTGMTAYSLAAAKSIIKGYKKGSAKVIIDNEKFDFSRLWTLIITKIDCYGYGFKVVPEAKVDDKKLHLLAIDSDKNLGYALFSSALGKNRAGKYFSGKKVTVSTEKDEFLQIGGDIGKKKKNFTFEVLPEVLKLRY